MRKDSTDSFFEFRRDALLKDPVYYLDDDPGLA